MGFLPEGRIWWRRGGRRLESWREDSAGEGRIKVERKKGLDTYKSRGGGKDRLVDLRFLGYCIRTYHVHTCTILLFDVIYIHIYICRISLEHFLRHILTPPIFTAPQFRQQSSSLTSTQHSQTHELQTQILHHYTISSIYYPLQPRLLSQKSTLYFHFPPAPFRVPFREKRHEKMPSIRCSKSIHTNRHTHTFAVQFCS